MYVLVTNENFAYSTPLLVGNGRNIKPVFLVNSELAQNVPSSRQQLFKCLYDIIKLLLGNELRFEPRQQSKKKKTFKVSLFYFKHFLTAR